VAAGVRKPSQRTQSPSGTAAVPRHYADLTTGSEMRVVHSVGSTQGFAALVRRGFMPERTTGSLREDISDRNFGVAE